MTPPQTLRTLQGVGRDSVRRLSRGNCPSRKRAWWTGSIYVILPWRLCTKSRSRVRYSRLKSTGARKGRRVPLSCHSHGGSSQHIPPSHLPQRPRMTAPENRCRAAEPQQWALNGPRHIQRNRSAYQQHRVREIREDPVTQSLSLEGQCSALPRHWRELGQGPQTTLSGRSSTARKGVGKEFLCRCNRVN